jgi:aminoglycoside phosphotransferase (APT) family kinase protein
MTERDIARLVARQCGVDSERLRVSATTLGGGLECDVRRVSVAGIDPRCLWPTSVVIKELRGAHRRELDIYRLLPRVLTDPPAPRLLAAFRRDGVDYLLMTDVAPVHAWPWARPHMAAAVCRNLARLHASRGPVDFPDDWDYESALAASAEDTLEWARVVSTRHVPRPWPRLGDLRRVVGALPAIRALLLAETTLIHGDVHPGNVLVPTSHGHANDDTDPVVVFIDWGRARIGSPLEDVASWLQSLGAWEPQARRFHDSLLRAYLAACGRGWRLDAELRTRYWLAGACNGLAGAIRYHLWRAGDSSLPERGRVEATRALHAWRRVIRRAAIAVRSLAS